VQPFSTSERFDDAVLWLQKNEPGLHTSMNLQVPGLSGLVDLNPLMIRGFFHFDWD
jgi:hypothetical protein